MSSGASGDHGAEFTLLAIGGLSGVGCMDKGIEAGVAGAACPGGDIYSYLFLLPLPYRKHTSNIQFRIPSRFVNRGRPKSKPNFENAISKLRAYLSTQDAPNRNPISKMQFRIPTRFVNPGRPKSKPNFENAISNPKPICKPKAPQIETPRRKCNFDPQTDLSTQGAPNRNPISKM